MSVSSLEGWAYWTGVSAVAFTAVAALLGLLSWFFSSRLAIEKDAALHRFQTESTAATALADARAAEANQAAEEARQKAAGAEEGSAKALSDVAAANERAGRLELEAASQRERAAKAERDLLVLQRRIEPRQIGRVNGEQLIAALKQAAPKGSVDVTCVLGDAEGAAFATQLDQILKASGWTTTGVSQSVYTGGNPQGWGLLVRAGSPPPPHAEALRQAFASAGFPLQVVENPEVAPGSVRMLIGNKDP